MYVVDVLRHTLGPIHTPPPLSAWPVAKTSEEIASLKYTHLMKICLATTRCIKIDIKAMRFLRDDGSGLVDGDGGGRRRGGAGGTRKRGMAAHLDGNAYRRKTRLEGESVCVKREYRIVEQERNEGRKEDWICWIDVGDR